MTRSMANHDKSFIANKNLFRHNRGNTNDYVDANLAATNTGPWDVATSSILPSYATALQPKGSPSHVPASHFVVFPFFERPNSTFVPIIKIPTYPHIPQVQPTHFVIDQSPPPQQTKDTSSAVIVSLFAFAAVVVVFVAVSLFMRPRWRGAPRPPRRWNRGRDRLWRCPIFRRRPEHALPSGNDGIPLQTWTQVPSNIPQPPPAVTTTHLTYGDAGGSTNPGLATSGGGNTSDLRRRPLLQAQNQFRYPSTGFGNTPPKSRSKSAPLPPLPEETNQETSRLSTVSTAPHTSSPDNSRAGSEIGLAIDSVPDSDAQGLRQQVVSSSTVTAGDNGETTILQSTGMPDCPDEVRVRAIAGRALIKTTSYTPSSYPQVYSWCEQGRESLHTRSHDQRQSAQDRGVSEASASNLVFPAPSSSQLTLHPDRSMHVTPDAETITGFGHQMPDPVGPLERDKTDVRAPTLGSTDSVDFAVSKPRASLADVLPPSGGKERVQSERVRPLSDDEALRRSTSVA